MPLARVVSFDGVSSDRMTEMQREMQGSERVGFANSGRLVFVDESAEEIATL
jgi:hypothetical protein